MISDGASFAFIFASLEKKFSSYLSRYIQQKPNYRDSVLQTLSNNLQNGKWSQGNYLKLLGLLIRNNALPKEWFDEYLGEFDYLIAIGRLETYKEFLNLLFENELLSGEDYEQKMDFANNI